eukprot:scaffold28233_cov171-Skeletonema_menzelii.AAC.1
MSAMSHVHTIITIVTNRSNKYKYSLPQSPASSAASQSTANATPAPLASATMVTHPEVKTLQQEQQETIQRDLLLSTGPYDEHKVSFERLEVKEHQSGTKTDSSNSAEVSTEIAEKVADVA